MHKVWRLRITNTIYSPLPLTLITNNFEVPCVPLLDPVLFFLRVVHHPAFL